jgi:hypothetical protein
MFRNNYAQRFAIAPRQLRGFHARANVEEIQLLNDVLQFSSGIRGLDVDDIPIAEAFSDEIARRVYYIRASLEDEKLITAYIEMLEKARRGRRK